MTMDPNIEPKYRVQAETILRTLNSSDNREEALAYALHILEQDVMTEIAKRACKRSLSFDALESLVGTELAQKYYVPTVGD